MTRAAKITIGTVVAGGLLGFTGWRLLQPRLKFATLAEVKAVVDPKLLESLPSSEPGQMEALDKLLKTHVVLKNPAASNPAKEQEWAHESFAKNRLLIEKVTHLLEQGPVQPNRRDLLEGGFPSYNQFKQFVKYSALGAQYDLSHGDRTAALSKLSAGFRLCDAYLGNCQTLIEYLVAVAMHAIVDATAEQLSRDPGLTTPELNLLLRFVKPFDPEAKIARRSILGEFQYYMLIFLPRLSPYGEEEKAVGDAFMTSQGSHPIAGQYDAIESAKLASRIYSAHLGNVAQPYGKRSTSVDTYLANLESEIPQDDYSGLDPGPEKTAKELWYRVRMNNVPNSLGKELLIASGSIGSDMHLSVCKVRTERECFRALLALQLFKRQHKSYPLDLEQLVKARLLPSVPQDFMSGEPLRYMPSKRVVYSVGFDLHDDGGAVTSGKRPFVSTTDDWGYRLP